MTNVDIKITSAFGWNALYGTRTPTSVTPTHALPVTVWIMQQTPVRSPLNLAGMQKLNVQAMIGGMVAWRNGMKPAESVANFICYVPDHVLSDTAKLTQYVHALFDGDCTTQPEGVMSQ